MTPITAVCWLNNTSREIHPAGATAQCSGAATRQLTSSDERPERNETVRAQDTPGVRRGRVLIVQCLVVFSLDTKGPRVLTGAYKYLQIEFAK